MATKYIVNNVSGQTITGNLTINGNLTVTGNTNVSSTYKAVLTQTGVITGTNISSFNYYLILGETYTIVNYVAGDDFSNVANVTVGTINTTGCEFIATGDTPFNWTNGSELSSSGNLVVDVIENTLGYDMVWTNQISTGVYLGVPSTLGPLYNNFQREKTSVLTQQTLSGPPFALDYIKYFASPSSFTNKDDSVALYVWDSDTAQGVNNTLYYTPIEINVERNFNTTPIIISGSVISSYPFNYASVGFICDSINVDDIVGDDTTVNSLSKLIAELNSNTNTNVLGVYSDDGSGGVLLTMNTNLANQFCSTGTLTFEVFAD